jgi:hypothetical protein
LGDSQSGFSAFRNSAIAEQTVDLRMQQTLSEMLAWMVAPEFTSDAAIQFKIGRRATK